MNLTEAMNKAKECSFKNRWGTVYSVYYNKKTKEYKVSCYYLVYWAGTDGKNWKLITQFYKGNRMM